MLAVIIIIIGGSIIIIVINGPSPFPIPHYCIRCGGSMLEVAGVINVLTGLGIIAAAKNIQDRQQ